MNNRFIFLIFFVLFIGSYTCAQHAGFYYTSPKSNAGFVNPEQIILLKSNQTIADVDNSKVVLTGTKSGQVSFSLEVESGNQLFIRADKPFGRGEKIELILESGAIWYAGSYSEAFSLAFSTEKEDNTYLSERYYQREDEIELNQVKVREDNPSRYSPPENDNNYPVDYPIPIVENLNDPYPGYLFINLGARSAPDYESYSAILDNSGIPIWFYKDRARDLKILADQTFTHDYRNNANLALQGYVIMDDQFEASDTIRMGNGYFVDTHDMLLLDNGHYLMMAYDPQVVDMSEIVEGGDTAAIVTGFVVQEVDVDQNVYFEWRSWDYVEITDVSDTVDLTADEIDYVHGNAFEFDLDGNLMISMRNMEEITKINYETGDIIWRLGLRAKKNEFTFNDTIGWSWQHDIRQLPNGNITVFDNGRNHVPEQFSQAVEYQIDEENMIATLVWNHREDPDIYRPATGSHRRIADDRSLIGWGMGWPLLATEISTDGERHLDLIGPTGVNNYRVQKYDWIHNVFTFNKDTLDFGEYDDYVPVFRTFSITNQMAQDTIRITSSHNHLNDFWVTTQFPLVIPPGEDENIIVSFQPQENGVFNDVLTLNYDNADTTIRISRQIMLTGRTKDNQAPEVLISPLNGTTDVLPLTEPSLLFNEPVKLATGDDLTNENVKTAIDFRMFDAEGAEVSYSAIVTKESQIVEIKPDEPLAVDQSYYLSVLPDKLMDASGNVLIELTYAYFTTGKTFGIDELENDKVSLYPNPTDDIINLSIDLPGEKKIRVFNPHGQKIIEVNTTASIVQLSTSDFSKGVYTGLIEADGRMAFFKFVKK